MTLLPEVRRHYGKLKFFIDGEWVEPKSDKYAPVTNPATGEVIAEVPFATDEEINMAAEAAQKGFEKWRNTPLRDRARIMWNYRAKFDEHFEELSRVLTQDHGRTIDESRGSVRRVVENIESACASMYSTTLGTHVVQLATGIDQYRIWEPMGVFLIIPPFNIPMHALSSFVPYALACGCSVIVSPSRQCPVSADMTFKVMEEVEGFPPGVFNLLHGGRTINNKILSHPLVKGVGFIGSSAVGAELFELCGKLHKVSSLNGNGKNHVVIMPDVDDLDKGVQYLLRGCFGMTGQRCLGTDQVVIMGDDRRYGEVKKKFAEAAAAMKLGYGLDESVELGPLTTQGGKDKVLRWIDTGLKEGAKIVLDGRNPKVAGYPNGYFLAPTIMENVTPDMNISQEEAFGPVANLLRSNDLDEVIKWINATAGGHSAALITSSQKSARKFIREVDVGNVSINAGVAQPYAFFPMGSRREAFLGMGKSRADSFRLFMDQKTVIERWI
jgi:malonate-semialdehyde dehydrogenase (acetylating)/methylmalonate-semialdehyde dehydrogenase